MTIDDSPNLYLPLYCKLNWKKNNIARMFSGMIHCLDNRDKMWTIWVAAYTGMKGRSTNSRATGRKIPFHSSGI